MVNRLPLIIIGMTFLFFNACPSTVHQTQLPGASKKELKTLQEGRAKILELKSQDKQHLAIKAYRELYSKNKENPVYLYLYGFALKDNKKKWKLFDQCLRYNPKFYWCLIGRGNVYVAWRIWDRAKADFKEASQLKPNQPEPTLGLADIAFTKHHNEEAIQLYKKVLKQLPNNKEANLGLAILYERNNDRPNAIHWYQKLLKLDPKNFEALRSLGKLYEREKQYSKAAHTWEQALQLRPKHFRLHIDLAEVYEKLNEQSKALALYEKASKLPQVHFKTYYKLGILRAAAGNIDGAIQAFHEALKLNKSHTDTLYRLGKLYIQKGEPKKALPHLRKATAQERKNINYRVIYAQALQQSKEYADALQEYQAILRMAPKNHAIRAKMQSLLKTLGLSDKTISGKTISLVLKKAKRIIMRCYRARLKEKPKLKGKLVIVLRIPRNDIIRVSWREDLSTLSDPIVKTCVKWTFQRSIFPRKGIKINYTFDF